MKTIEIAVKGMDCAECAVHVQRAIRSVPKVHDAQVYLAAEKAKIMYQDDPPDFNLIQKSVKQAGYRAFIKNQQDHSITGLAGKGKMVFMLSSILFLITILITVTDEWFGLFDGITQNIPRYIWLGVILIGGYPIFRNVLSSLFKGQIILHTLMTLGVIAAALVGEWITAVVVVMFMHIGNFVEDFTTSKARRAIINLTSMMPRTARIEKNGKEIIIPIEKVNLGEIVIIRPGEMVPINGLVVNGHASVDQSAISGESMPLEITRGSKIYTASIIKTGMLKVKITAIGADSTFGKIIKMVEEAETQKGSIQRPADRFSGYYLPFVAGIAILTYLFRGDPLASAAVLVVACSCSFALATPIAMLASIGSAAGQGFLIKGGKYLELLSQVDTLFVDKTGTLTLGQPKITDIISFDSTNKDFLLKYAASAERYSEHPLAEAIRQMADDSRVKLLHVQNFNNVPGKGIFATVNKHDISILNKVNLINKYQHETAENLRKEGKTLLFIEIDKVLVGVMAAADTPRKESREAIQNLKNTGIHKIKLLSGDNRVSVKALADQLEIDYQAEMLPEEKIKVIKDSQRNGHIVAMVGDGINDAPALAQADVGFAMGAHGSEIAIEAAHITLLRDDWLLVPKAFEVAKRTMDVVKGNILFTMLYNLIGLGLAAFGFLPPVLAAAMQFLPDIGILANSTRLYKQHKSVRKILN